MVAVVMRVHPVVAVYHQLKVYPVRVGLVGRVQTVDHGTIFFVVGVCHVHPLASNVTSTGQAVVLQACVAVADHIQYAQPFSGAGLLQYLD